MMPNRLFTPFFPKATGPSTRLDPNSLPERPDSIGPVFDPEHSSEPIEPFDENRNTAYYGESNADGEPNLPPEDHADSTSRYLFPTLTKHERMRLTLLWYYTRDVVNDKEFLLRLQEKLDLVQQFMGWEFAILGLVSEDVFSRLVTAGLPLAVLPRRESTCSHTINLPTGVGGITPDIAH